MVYLKFQLIAAKKNLQSHEVKTIMIIHHFDLFFAF